MRQVRPKTEGWQQKKDAEGRPLLQFASPKRGKPPVHLADLTPDERVAKVKELGLPGFRAKQLEKHYFTHWTHDPADDDATCPRRVARSSCTGCCRRC